jgi:ribosomal-protein-alanine N-acetyltransferase
MSNILVESERLLIRRPQAEDLKHLQRVFCDPVMMQYLGGSWTSEQVADALREWSDEWGVNNRWYGILLRKDNGEPIGTAGFTENTIPVEPGLELSWFVLPEHQRQGFATEITKELVRHAFEDLGAVRIVGETHPGNPGSQRVLEKLGFEYIGERHHKYDHLPGLKTEALWALTRAEWQNKTD